MLRLRCPLLLSLVAAAALVPAAPSPAATSAQRFADAVERGKSAIRAKKPEFRAAVEAMNLDSCERVLEKKPPPEREADRFVLFLVAASVQPLFQPSLPVLDQIVAELGAIPTRDPILKSGRAAWREVVVSFRAFPTVEKPCEQLEAWADAGWKASARPKFDFAGFERQLDEVDDENIEGKFERAARRMRQLGVSKGDAERFTGETLFEDVEDELDETALGSDEDIEEFQPSSEFRIDYDFDGNE